MRLILALLKQRSETNYLSRFLNKGGDREDY